MHYTIIAGSNRQGSYTEKVARVYQELLETRGVHPAFLSLYGTDILERTPRFVEMEASVLVPAQKFIMIVPEYNGTFPGVLKAMIDNTDIKKVWYHKKALLTGVSLGRAGNLRGLDHLAASLHFMKVHVHHDKLPISVIDKVMTPEGKLDEATMKAVTGQLEDFIAF